MGNTIKKSEIIVEDDLRGQYARMAADEVREREAEEWCEGLLGAR
jgi:hypothetical protein